MLEIERRQERYQQYLTRKGLIFVDVTARELHDFDVFLEMLSSLGLGRGAEVVPRRDQIFTTRPRTELHRDALSVAVHDGHPVAMSAHGDGCGIDALAIQFPEDLRHRPIWTAFRAGS